jgi:hypothetical protein
VDKAREVVYRNTGIDVVQEGYSRGRRHKPLPREASDETRRELVQLRREHDRKIKKLEEELDDKLDKVRHDVARRFNGLEIDACPFVNLPEKKRTMWALTKEEMKNCRWLKPELVAQIEFAEWTPDGHLRHSKFVGLREDKDAREVLHESDD